jgi:DNA-binding transcriptional regulator YhcF (GntR family)
MPQPVETPSRQPRWAEIRDALLEQLRGTAFARGDSFYTLDQLCAQYEVSRMTARRVCDELRREGWIESRRKTGSRVLRAGPATTLHFVYSTHGQTTAPAWHVNSVIFSAIRDGLAEVVAQDGGRLAAIGSGFFFSHLEAFRGSPVVLLGEVFTRSPRTTGEFRDELLTRLRQAHLRPVMVHAPDRIPGLPLVRCDHEQGMYEAVAHLAARGARRIALLTGPTANAWFLPRFSGYCRALRDHGLPFHLEFVRETLGDQAAQDEQALAEWLARAEPPDAVVCGNDERALHLLAWCHRQGIAVPGRLRIAGFDNVAEAALARPPLTTVETSWHEQGAAAARLALGLDRQEDESPEIVLPPRLIVRASTQ